MVVSLATLNAQICYWSCATANVRHHFCHMWKIEIRRKQKITSSTIEENNMVAPYAIGLPSLQHWDRGFALRSRHRGVSYSCVVCSWSPYNRPILHQGSSLQYQNRTGQWFPKCVPRKPGDSQPVPMGLVDTFLISVMVTLKFDVLLKIITHLN